MVPTLMRNHFPKVMLLAGLLLICGVSTAQAALTRECKETWYPQAEVDEAIYELKPTKQAKCQDIKIDMVSSRFGVIEGKGYFITRSEKTSYACPRVGSGDGIPHFACMLPKTLQNDVLLEERNYYLLTPNGADLRPIGDSGYVTDGRTVFLLTTVVKGADPDTFHPIDAKDGDRNPKWAGDKDHVYYEESVVPDLVRGGVKFAGPFVVNNNLVYRFDSIDGVYLRSDVRPDLTLLSPASVYYGSIVSDGERVYLNGKALEEIPAGDIQMLSPSCPVPGHPELRCSKAFDLSNGTSERFRFARIGSDVLNFWQFDKIIRILDVPEFAYFQPADSDRVFGINGQQLFSVDNFQNSTEPRVFHGRISGPIAGALTDQAGFITSFRWSNFTLCQGYPDTTPWPKSNGLAHLGPLRRLPDIELPKGFKVALENQRYRYLFVSLDERSADDTIIDLHSGVHQKTGCK